MGQAENISTIARTLGLPNNIANALGIVLGIAMCTLLLIVAGGLSQILKHRGNPYQRAGAKITTIKASLGLFLSLLVIILLNLFNDMLR